MGEETHFYLCVREKKYHCHTMQEMKWPAVLNMDAKRTATKMHEIFWHRHTNGLHQNKKDQIHR
jgi:hypothetical protein